MVLWLISAQGGADMSRATTQSTNRKTRRSGNITKPIRGESELIREAHALRQQAETQRGQTILAFGKVFRKAQRAGELRNAWKAAGMSKRSAYYYLDVYDLHKLTNINARKVGASDLTKLAAQYRQLDAKS
jgi:hypothetical protein